MGKQKNILIGPGKGIFVDAKGGKDRNPGTVEKPKRTISVAIKALSQNKHSTENG